MSNINLGQDMTTLSVGLKQAKYTGVLLHAGKNDNGETLDYLAGTSANVLEVTVPNGSKAMAQMILDGLSKRGYQYQPFEAERTVTDPAIEIGDNVTANGTKGVVMSYDIAHSRLMAPTLKAPFDEEVNHEFKFESRTQRQFNRESAYTRSRLTINADAITAEVARATNSEGELRATLNVQADEISAKVSNTGGSASSFGWTLTDSDWSLFSGGSTVLKATSSGIEVSGKITATSGYIGTASSGFEIGSSYIRNGMTAYDDTENNGIYIGTNGISLGGGKFKVNAAGGMTASNVAIRGGSIQIKDANDNVAFQVTSTGALTATTGTFSGNVYAGNIQYGGSYGTMGGGGITGGSLGTGQLSVGVNTSLNHADTAFSYFNGITFAGTFSAHYMAATNSISSPSISSTNGGETIYLSSHKHYVSVSGGTVSINGPAPSNTSGNSFNIADTTFYQDAVASAYTNGAASVSVSSVSYISGGSSYVQIGITLSNESYEVRMVRF